jgi:hypothetical protein
VCPARCIVNIKLNKTLATVLLLRPFYNKGRPVFLLALISAIVLQCSAVKFIVSVINNKDGASEYLDDLIGILIWINIVSFIGLVIFRGIYEAIHKWRLRAALRRGILNDCTWKYPELYSIAINSLIEKKGRYYSSREPFEPIVIIIDADGFGRILFYYNENPALREHYLIISQKSIGIEICYLSGGNVISAPNENCKNICIKTIINNMATHEVIVNEICSLFSETAIEKFRIANDWNKLLFQRKKPLKVDVIEKINTTKNNKR